MRWHPDHDVSAERRLREAATPEKPLIVKTAKAAARAKRLVLIKRAMLRRGR